MPQVLVVARVDQHAPEQQYRRRDQHDQQRCRWLWCCSTRRWSNTSCLVLRCRLRLLSVKMNNDARAGCLFCLIVFCFVSVCFSFFCFASVCFWFCFSFFVLLRYACLTVLILLFQVVAPPLLQSYNCDVTSASEMPMLC
eukprot:m.213496 g.213496  ORF g.213496 m.213496 type:complete len:140 (-) comp16956_c0_seq6:120-539(-)